MYNSSTRIVDIKPYHILNIQFQLNTNSDICKISFSAVLEKKNEKKWKHEKKRFFSEKKCSLTKSF